MVLLPRLAKVPKNAFSSLFAILRSKSRIPGFAIAFIGCRISVCTQMSDYNTPAGPVKCCFADPLYSKFEQTLQCHCWGIYNLFSSPKTFWERIKIPLGRNFDPFYQYPFIPFVSVKAVNRSDCPASSRPLHISSGSPL